MLARSLGRRVGLNLNARSAMLVDPSDGLGGLSDHVKASFFAGLARLGLGVSTLSRWLLPLWSRSDSASSLATASFALKLSVVINGVFLDFFGGQGTAAGRGFMFTVLRFGFWN